MTTFYVTTFYETEVCFWELNKPDSEADDSGDLKHDRLWCFFSRDDVFSLENSSSDWDDSYKCKKTKSK